MRKTSHLFIYHLQNSKYNKNKGVIYVEINTDLLSAILDAYDYEIVFVDRHHIIRYMNKTAKIRYGNQVQIGNSLFNCHNENSKAKIDALLA